MSKAFLILITILFVSCGPNTWVGDKPKPPSRVIASVGTIELGGPDELSFNQSALEKLQSLHMYYVLGQKNLGQFDKLLEEESTRKLHVSRPYLNLLAIRTQVEEIEHEFLDLKATLTSQKTQENTLRLRALRALVKDFAARSKLSSMSMENLQARLQLGAGEATEKSRDALPAEVEEELKKLEESKEFQVYETNVEHLSYMLEPSTHSSEKKFYPSLDAPGNITGNEFPAKVWSLTFDDGPSRNTSALILQNLKNKKLKATFFQLAGLVKANPALAREIKNAGMEIASHSYSHAQLTKVGSSALDKEITQATMVIEKVQGVDVEFYRLPYGAGVRVPQIRQRIVDGNLIHVFWNVDTLDWMAQTPEKIIKRTKAMMRKTPKDAGVILFHDIHLRTTVASAAIMDFLKQDDRRSCTLKEIVTQMNQGVSKVCSSK
ncbi:MAG TPA: polysaccharide deacetylase family protein [Bacteriovoracaceae bacterium]|nr:polysaccharide deacetylase family protein [Bacteriovoracaceae bacterium]